VYGNPLEVTFPDGTKQFWTRDNLDQILTFTDELGRVTTYTRDDRHRVTEILYPDNTKELFTYNAFGQVLSHTLRNGGIENNVYDARGLKTSYTDALGNVSAYTYDGADRMASVTDARGNTTMYEYNERGLLTRVRNADGSAKLYAYDTFGNLTGTTNEIGNTWSTTFDEFKRPVLLTDPLNRVITYNYDLPGGVCGCANSNNTPTKITSPGGMVTKFEYDVEWKIIRETEGAGSADEASSSFEYDLKGNLTSIIDPMGKEYKTVYDARDRSIKSINPLGHSTSMAYDAAGNQLTIQRADGSTTSYLYDNMNRQTRITDANGQLTLFQYDAEGNTTKLTDANNNSHLYQYDLLNRKTEISYPDGSVERYMYDPVGNVSTYRNRTGKIRSYAYDNRDREILSAWNDNTPSVTRTYDQANRLLTMISSVSTLLYDYTAANELKSESQAVSGGSGPHVVQYTYDADGLQSSMKYPVGNVLMYSYTGRHQMSSINLDGSTTLASYQYDLNGNRVSRQLVNATKTIYAFDAFNRTITVDNQNVTGSFARFDYQYDLLNRRTSVKRNAGQGDVYSYDAIDQVTQVLYEAGSPDNTPVNPSKTVLYNFDPAGNRTLVTENGAPANYTSNNLNQYTNVAGIPITYDGSGNMENVVGWTFTYDAQNRMVKAVKEGTMLDFMYDARNRCVKRTINGTESFFYYDEWNILEERGTGGNFLAAYIHGAMVDELVAKAYPGGAVFYHYDVQGSVYRLSDLSGNIVEGYSYDVYGKTTVRDGFGNTIPGSSFGNRFMYTGREYIHEIGIYDYRNRMYVPDMGKFMQPDPIRFLAGDVNLYRYVGNNPANWMDYLGLNGDLGVPRAGSGGKKQNCMGHALCDSRRWEQGAPRTKENPWPEEKYLQDKKCRKIECKDQCDEKKKEQKVKLYEWLKKDQFHIVRENSPGKWSGKVGDSFIYDFGDPDKHNTAAYGIQPKDWRESCWCCPCKP
jgi:RHS repeat-associated protein